MKLGARTGETRLERRTIARLEKQRFREQKEAAEKEKRFQSGLRNTIRRTTTLTEY
jgi:hypothetical protein